MFRDIEGVKGFGLEVVVPVLMMVSRSWAPDLPRSVRPSTGVQRYHPGVSLSTPAVASRVCRGQHPFQGGVGPVRAEHCLDDRYMKTMNSKNLKYIWVSWGVFDPP